MADVQEDSVSFEIQASAEKANEEISKLTSNMGKLNKVVSSLKIGAWVAGMKAVTNSVVGFISKTSDMINANNMFKISVGEVSDKTQDFLDKAQKLAGLDPTKTMEAFSSFARITKSFGLPKEEIDIMSRNLTQLTADISATGRSWEESMKKVRSGLVGELEPMRAIGVALDKNTVQQTMNSLGINKRYDELTRLQKTEMLYYQMMKSTENIQGTMAKTMLSPTQALRVMKTEFLALARDVGTIFIPIFMKIIPVVRAVVQILGEAVRWIAGFFGIDLKKFEIQTEDIGDNIGGIGNNIDNVGKKAKKTKKELDKMLMPFDELNNVKFDTGDKSGSGSGSGAGAVGGGSLGLDLPEYDMFKGMSQEINEQVEQIKNKIKEMMPLIVTIAGLATAIFAGIKIADFVMWLAKVIEAFKTLSEFAGALQIIGGVFMIIGGAISYVAGIFDILNPKVDYIIGLLKALARSCFGCRRNPTITSRSNGCTCSRNCRTCWNTRSNNMAI